MLAFGQGGEESGPRRSGCSSPAYAKSSARKADAAFYLGRLLIVDQPDRALELLYARANGKQGAEYEIGTLLAEQGDIAEAETYWREAAAAGRLEAQEKLAELYHDRGQHTEAGRPWRASHGAVPRPGRSGRRRRHAAVGQRL